MDEGRKQSSTTSHMTVAVTFTQYRPQPVQRAAYYVTLACCDVLFICGPVKVGSPTVRRVSAGIATCIRRKSCAKHVSYAVHFVVPVTMEAAGKMGIKLAVDAGAC